MIITAWTAHTPSECQVKDVDVRIDQPASPQLAELLDDAELKPVDSTLIEQIGDFALRAFDHWLRIVRWRTGHWRIGRLERHQRAYWGTYIHETSTNRRLPGSMTIVVRGEHVISNTNWNDIQSVLDAERESPLCYDLFFDGEEHLADGDLRRCVIDFANAVEVLLKTLLEASAAETLAKPYRDQLLKTPARILLTKLGKPLIGDDSWNRFGNSNVNTLGRLFEARNEALHGHERFSITEAQCSTFRTATKELLSIIAVALDRQSATRISAM